MRLGPLSVTLGLDGDAVALAWKLHLPQLRTGVPLLLHTETARAERPTQPAAAPPGPVERYGEGVLDLPEGDYRAVVTIVSSAGKDTATVAPDHSIPIPDVDGKERPLGTSTYPVTFGLTLAGQVNEAITKYCNEVLDLRGDPKWRPTTGKYGVQPDPFAEAEVPDGTPVDPETAASLAAGIGFLPPPPAAVLALDGQVIETDEPKATVGVYQSGVGTQYDDDDDLYPVAAPAQPAKSVSRGSDEAFHAEHPLPQPTGLAELLANAEQVATDEYEPFPGWDAPPAVRDSPQA